MPLGETLAYLAGLLDGDGYFKVSRAYRTPGTVHPYYATTVGVSQLWPGEAVRCSRLLLGRRHGPEKDFGRTIDGTVRTPWVQGGIGREASPPFPPVEEGTSHSPHRNWTTEAASPPAGPRTRSRVRPDGRGTTGAAVVSRWDSPNREAGFIAALFGGLPRTDSRTTWMDPTAAAHLSRRYHRE